MILDDGKYNHELDSYARIKGEVWNQQPDVLSILIGVNDVWHELSENPNGVELTRWERSISHAYRRYERTVA